MKSYNEYLKITGEFGEVTEIKLPLVTVTGLPSVAPFELVLFESGIVGEVFAIHKHAVEIILFSKKSPATGEKVVRTKELLQVPVGSELLGAVIDPTGGAIGTSAKVAAKKTNDLNGKVMGITSRASITKPFDSGMTVIDMLLPLGKGQKQLIIGDRKTGKTSFLLSILKAQAKTGTVVIYAAIGKKQSDVRHVLAYIESEKLQKQTVVVASNSSDSPGLIYLTPFTAMTIAEGFRDEGKDVVVILDDLSTHAKFYREMSLIGKRFPGRESYPGDIFFTHSRLLERSGNFLQEGKKEEVSITCLPVVETVESDLTSYIATNIMSMTDGHIFFDQGTFAKGRRPAINIPLSVTRVGRQAQSPLRRDINQKLTAFLSLFEQMENLSHFGAELSGKVQNTIKTGERIHAFLNQPKHVIIDTHIQLVVFALMWGNSIEDADPASIQEKIRKLAEASEKDAGLKKTLLEITSVENLDDLLLQVNQKRDQFSAIIGEVKTVTTETVVTTEPPAAPGSTPATTPANPPTPQTTTVTKTITQTDSILFVPMTDKK
ncbi:MAG: F0F1 ATP synthase subunit alpha [Microgenomates group bacterium]